MAPGRVCSIAMHCETQFVIGFHLKLSKQEAWMCFADIEILKTHGDDGDVRVGIKVALWRQWWWWQPWWWASKHHIRRRHCLLSKNFMWNTIVACFVLQNCSSWNVCDVKQNDKWHVSWWWLQGCWWKLRHWWWCWWNCETGIVSAARKLWGGSLLSKSPRILIPTSSSRPSSWSGSSSSSSPSWSEWGSSWWWSWS